MTTENEKILEELRLAALEIRMGSVEAILNRLVGATAKTSRSRSNAEKQKLKASLLKKLPYDKNKLDKLTFSELQMLASALGFKSFGIKREEIVKTILSKQKK